MARFLEGVQSVGNPAERLAELYYNGVDGLSPVVNFAAYQPGAGQIRTNQFVDRTWQLREFNTIRARSLSGNFVFLVRATVKVNPWVELYNTQRNSSPAEREVQTRFVRDLLSRQVPMLTAPESAGSNDAFSIINGFGMNNNNDANEFQSSVNSSDNVETHLSQSLRVSLGIRAEQRGMTEQQLINRIQTQTCAGCHHQSNGADVGTRDNNVRWPRSLGFVHINEQGRLSDALNQFFLPARALLMEDFLCSLDEQEPEPEPEPIPDPPRSSPPTMVRNLRGKALSDNTIEILWDRSTDSDGTIVGYDVMQDGVVVADRDATSHIARNLPRGSLVSFAVSAVDNDGNRSSPAAISVRTLGDGPTEPEPPTPPTTTNEPSTPGNIRGEVYSSSAFEVFWDRSSDPNGSVVGYEVKMNGAVQTMRDAGSFFADGQPSDTDFVIEVRAIDNDGLKSNPARITLRTF